jgi:hypothetical protein
MSTPNPLLEPTLRLYEEAQQLLRSITRLANTLKTIALILSVLTTGSLWLVLTKALPEFTLWAGAVASTAATFIALYLKSTGSSRKHGRAIVIHGDIAQLLAKVRSGQIQEGDFWSLYKNLEHDLFTIKNALNEGD